MIGGNSNSFHTRGRRGKLESALLTFVLGALGAGALAFWMIKTHGFRKEETQVEEDTTLADLDKSLTDARQRADRLDPNWRFSALLEHRAAVGGAKNGALAVLNASKTLSLPWTGEKDFNEVLAVKSKDKLSSKQAQALADALSTSAPALRELLRLTQLPAGKYPVEWETDGAFTALPHLEVNLAAQHVLYCEILKKIHDQDAAAALAGVHALLNCGTSVGDEPTSRSLLVRQLAHPLVVQGLERILYHVQPTESALAETQKQLAQEDAVPLLVMKARALRAEREELLAKLTSGDLDLNQISQVLEEDNRSLADRVSYFLEDPMARQRGPMKILEAWMLNYLTDLVECAKRPETEQAEALNRLYAATRDCPKAGRILIPPVGLIVESTKNGQALMRAAITCLALERYRLAKKDWPNNLASLVPDYLPKIPADPFDGQPLRYVRNDEGVVVYSLGADGKDDGGKDLNSYKMNTDVGLRLWNPADRPKSPK